jgi:restriction system protein
MRTTPTPAALEEAFIEGGGYTEQLAAARMETRQRKKDQSDQSDQTDPSRHIPGCPVCGALMALRTARAGKNPGSQFWGCTKYPDCKAVLPV